MSTEQLENLEQLGQRAVACKRWRWMPGMLADTGLRIVRRDSDGYLAGCYAKYAYMSACIDGVWTDAPDNTVDCLPDLTDPATLGCLLALVREAWGPEATVSVNISGFWAVGGARIQKGKSAGHTINLGIWKATELEALVAALEVAP